MHLGGMETGQCCRLHSILDLYCMVDPYNDDPGHDRAGTPRPLI